MKVRTRADVKRRIMDAAFECFNFDGIRGVSADTIIKRADVAKMTLYKHYPTKNALAVAYVRARSEQWMTWLANHVKERRGSQQLLGLFDALGEWFKSEEYYGSPFHRAAAEFPNRKHPIHKEAVRNVHEFRRFVAELVADAKIRRKATLVNQLVILITGCEVVADMEGPAKHAQVARHMAARLLRRP